MEGFSNYMSSEVNDHIFGNDVYTAPSTIYVGLAKGTVLESDTGSSFDEADYGGYTRVALTNNLTNFPAAVDGVKTVAVDITFSQSTSGTNVIKEIVFLDAATGGNILAGGALLVEKTVNPGDQPVFLADEVEITVR